MTLAPPRAAARRAVLLTAAAALATVSLVGAQAAAAQPVEATVPGLDLRVGIASDGLGRFTPDDAPGGDSGPANGLVRTGDAVVYRVAMSTSGGSAEASVFRLDAPAGMSWARVPDECVAAESRIEGPVLHCALGTLTSGARTLSVVASVATSLQHGTTLTPTASGSAAGVDPVTAAVPSVRTSAVPRFDLSMNRSVPTFTPATGLDGSTPGYRIVYPLQVRWQGLVDGGGLLGLEQLAGGLSLVDDVSQMNGGAPSEAVLYPVDGAPACGVNTGQISSAPGGVGGGSSAVVDSGTVTCTQSAPGEPVRIDLAGTDTSLSSVPTTSVSGGQIAGGVQPYVVSAYVSLWVPAPPLGVSVTATNTYRDLVATSVSGRANYDGAAEPLDDNSVERNLLESAGISGSTRYRGWDTARRTSFDLSGKGGLPYVTPAQPLLTSTSLNNRGLGRWRGTIVCSVFDNSVQSLRENTPGNWAASNATGVTGRPEFAALDASDPAVARDATCGDDDLEWHSDPRDAPGGAAAVGAVRWTYDHPPTRTLTFNTHLTASPALANHVRMRTFSSIRTTSSAEWAHDWNEPDRANGPWADFLTVTSNTARIRSAIVDPGHDAEDTPDETAYVSAGGTLRYALYPTLTNASDDPLPEVVTVRDVLSEGGEFVTGSSADAPVLDTVEVDGTTRQRLTWTIDPAMVGEALRPITFDVRFAGTPAGVEATNTATIESSRDVSDESARMAHRTVHVLAGSGFDAVESVDAPVHLVGDQAVFTLTTRNTGSEPLPNSTLISTLPWDGDGRGTTTEAAPRLRQPVEPASASEVVRYAGRASGEVSLDPADPSNAPDGSTTWCLESELGRGGCPGTLGDATAVRVDTDVPLRGGSSVEHHLVVGSERVGVADAWASSFGTRVGGIDVTALSATVQTRVVAGSVSGLVWTDEDGDGVRTAGEPPREAHLVELTGTDDQGQAVTRAGASRPDGSYDFGSLRPGDYRLDFGSVPGGWTVAGAGDDPAADSDADDHGRVALRLDRLLDEDAGLDGVTAHVHVDAGALVDPVVAPPVDPPVVDPVGPGPGAGAGAGDDAAATAGDAARPRALAFTGGGLALLGAAGGLLLLAGLALRTRLRRSSGAETDEPVGRA